MTQDKAQPAVNGYSLNKGCNAVLGHLWAYANTLPPCRETIRCTVARPMSWEEQARLFKELPPHLARMALFKVNTGTREKEVCYLRWEWEVPVAEPGTSVFIIPEDRVKNGEERLLVMNRVARS